jgi:tryptophan synthase alpha chain
MSRIPRAFEEARARGRPALVAYVMAGHPDRERHLAYARAVLAECDVLEIGVPYSDPVADGPVIERAATRALEAGARMQDALDLARALRAEDPAKPLVLMTYYNPVLRRGLARFAHDAREAGVDGVILPDVPVEESAEPGAALAAEGVDLVQLASPATGPERLARLARATRGFLYVVSSFGVTGARREMAPETADVLERAASACRGIAPFAVGFGVSLPEHVRMLRDAGADGIVVGSAIVRRIDEGETPEAVGAFVRSLLPSGVRIRD